jgi:hypothetical protein
MTGSDTEPVPRWRRPGPLPDLARAAAWLVSVAVLCVSLARLGCLIRHPPCLTVHGERTWLDWAYRHPDPEALFRRIGAQLRPGEPIAVMAPLAEFESYWWHGMGSYFLWDHPLAATYNWRAQPPQRLPGQALVIVSERGEIRVLRGPPPP